MNDVALGPTVMPANTRLVGAVAAGAGAANGTQAVPADESAAWGAQVAALAAKPAAAMTAAETAAMESMSATTKQVQAFAGSGDWTDLFPPLSGSPTTITLRPIVPPRVQTVATEEPSS